MKKYTKKIIDGKYEVREYGHNFLYSREDFLKEVVNNNMFYKPNKLVLEKDVR